MHRLLLLGCLLACGPAWAEPDLVLTGGRIWTGDPARPEVTALAVEGNRIVATGDDAAISALAGAGTLRIELAGRRVVPGINDAHVHLGGSLAATDLGLAFPEPGADEIFEALRAQPRDGDGWLFGSIGGQAFADPRLALQALDALHPTRPVRLASWTGHGTLVNSAARRALAIDPAAPVAGGWYGRDASGAFDGRLHEYAQWRAMRLHGQGSDAATIATIRDYARDAVRLGVTSIQNMPIADSTTRFLGLWREARVPLRLRLIRLPTPAVVGEDDIGDLPPSFRTDSPPIHVSGTKWILDGTPVERGAALRAPYPGGDDAGRLNFSRDEIAALLRAIVARDDQPLLHVAGDAAVAAVLDAMASVAPAAEWRARRLRMEHGEGLTPDLLARTAEFGVVVVQNPAHLQPQDPATTAMFHARAYQPLADLLAHGIPLALGSDGPNNPWLNLMWAAAPGMRPDQAISREQALRAYTAGSAYAEFADTEKGLLAPGYLADLAVLSQDPLAVDAGALPGIHSVLTVIDGAVAWRDPAF